MSDKVKFEPLSQVAKKKKDFLIIILIGSIFSFIFISIGMAIFDTDKKKVFQERAEVENKKDFAIVGEKDYKENWALSVENKLEKNEENLQSFMETVVDENEKSKQELKDILLAMSAKQSENFESFKDSTNASLKRLKNQFEDRFLKQENRMEEIALQKGSGNLVIGSGTDKEIVLGDDFLPPKPVKGGRQPVQNNDNTDNFIDSLTKAPSKKGSQPISNVDEDLIPTKQTAKSKFSIKLVSLDTSANQTEIAKRRADIEKAKEEKEKESNSFHLATGLTQALMITGAYAPAFSSGDTEPLPVLLQAEGNILIANDDRLSVDKCMLIGSAKGNMNSQTADIRLVSISCSLGDGKKIIEGPISGWVIGENGIPGVQGELLHKNGAWLAKTFVAGFLQTFSDALANTGTTQISIGTTGGTNSVPVGQAVTNNASAAAAGGVSKVFGKLGDYYIKMAEQIFPVIEVKGGRTVDILLKGGEDFTVKDFGRMDINSINNRIENEKFEKVSKKEAKAAIAAAESDNNPMPKETASIFTKQKKNIIE